MIQDRDGRLTFSRRSLFALAGIGISGFGPLYAASSEFWNKKEPSDWTPEEIDRLITKSPWAKAVTAQYAAGDSGSRQGSPNGGGGYPGGGGGYPGGGGGYPGGGGGYPGGGGGYPGGGGGIGIGGIGIGLPRGRGMGGGRGGGRNGGAGRPSSYTGTVRWESAKPIVAAMKTPLPEGFANHYVISVNSIPLLTGRSESPDDDADSSKSRQNTLDDLKQFTTLQPKGRERAQPGVVQQPVGSGTVLLFGFAKDVLDLSKDDKEIDFSTRMGRLVVKAKFDIKEMLYRGQLAL